MEKQSLEMNLNRRKMLFKILRVVTSKLIRGEYHFSSVSEITAEDLYHRIKSDLPPIVIDTRSAHEFNAGFGHIPDSRLIPIMQIASSFPDSDEFKKKIKELESQFDEILPFNDKEIITICPGGGFSLVAAEIMVEAGFKDVKSLSGGIDGWFKQGYPTTLS